jgi:superfamily II DNA/RNA helicase
MVNNFVIQFRVVYMLQQNPPEISLKSVDYLIIDESDKLFEAGERGFRDQVTIYKTTISFYINLLHTQHHKNVKQLRNIIFFIFFLLS